MENGVNIAKKSNLVGPYTRLFLLLWLYSNKYIIQHGPTPQEKIRKSQGFFSTDKVSYAGSFFVNFPL